MQLSQQQGKEAFKYSLKERNEDIYHHQFFLDQFSNSQFFPSKFFNRVKNYILFYQLSNFFILY